MFDLATVSRPYAIAAYNYADSYDALDDWALFLEKLTNFTQSEKKLVSYFESFSAQNELLTNALVESLKIENAAMVNFLKIIQEAKRLGCVDEIYKQFSNLKRKKENSQKVIVQTALELNQKQLHTLKDLLAKNSNKSIELSVETNQELIGGFIIQIDDFVINRSIRAKLNQLKNQLLI